MRSESMPTIDEGKFRALVEVASDLIMELDLNGNVQYVNQRVNDILGYQPGEMLGRNIFDFMSPGEAQRVAQAYKEFATLKDKIHDFEHVFLHRNGQEIAVESSALPIIDKSGKLVGFSGISRDITKRRQAEEAIRKKAHLIDQVCYSIISTDVDGLVTGWNKGAEKIFGYSADETIGKNISLIYPEDQHDFLEHEVIGRLKQKGEIEIEAKLRRKSGQIFYGLLALSLLKADDGAIIGMLGSTIDITERKLAEEEKQRFENIVSSSDDMMALLDRNFVYLAANKAYLDAFRLEKQNIIGHSVSEIFGEKTFAEVVKPNAERCLAGDTVHYCEWFDFPAKGKFYREVDYYPYMGPNGEVKGFVVTARDATRRKQKEEALQDSENIMRGIFRAAPTGIGVVKNRIITDVNQLICEITGYAKEELVGKDARILYPTQEEFEFVGKEIYGRIAEWRTVFVETKWQRKDGAIVEILLGATPIDSADRSEGITFTVLDITKRRLAEIELQRSNNLLRAIIEAAPVAIIGLDLDGNVYNVWNPAAERMLGWSAHEAMGRPLPSVQEEGQEEFSRFQEIIRKGLTINGVEVRRQKRDGTPIDYSIYASPLRDSQGRISGNIALLVDITQRKEMERALETEKRRLAHILEGTNAGTWEWNVQTDETVFNERWAEMLGYTLDEISPVSLDTWKKFTHPDDLRKALESLDKHFTGESDYYTCEMRMRHKNGDWVWVLDRGKVATRTEDGKPLIMAGTHLDITERKRTEEALEKRLVALTRPLGDTADITFEDLFNVDDIQRLQDEFAQATGVSSLITRPDGTPITTPSNFCRFCSHIIRGTDIGRANCNRSDSELGRVLPDGPTIQPCLSAGLWGAGAGIAVGGRHIANWLIGQVRDEKRSVDEVRAYARSIGVDADEAAAAYIEIPAMPYERFERVSRALFTLANQLSAAAYQNVQQARFITERQRAEEALKESEDRFRSLAEQSQLGIAIIQDGVFKYVNKSLSDMNGYSMDEMMQWKPYEFMNTIHPDDRVSVQEQALTLQSSQSGAVPYHTFRGIRKNGEIRYMDLYSKTFIYQNRPANITTLIDTTDRRYAEKALRDSEEKLRRVLYSSPDAITVMDLSWKIIECNPATGQMYGYSSDDLPGTDFIKLVSPSHRDTVREFKDRCAHKEAAGKIECTMQKKDASEFPADISFGVINDSAGNPQYFVTIIRDLTQQKKLESQLIQSQKMESVGRLAGGVAHDFNNLLTAIIGHSDMIESRLKPGEKLLEDVKVIQQASDKAAQLTSQLLAFSRKQTLQPKIVDLNQIIANMLKMLKRIIGEDIVFNIVSGDNLWAIKVDPHQMEQVIVNLAVNSRDAMQGGGTLTIKTRNMEFEKETRHADIEIPAGKYVLLSVSDTGAGMTPEVMANIYEPFFTTKELGKGTGLGLPMVYGIVSQSEGQITVESGVGLGTTFSIYLPAIDGQIHTVDTVQDSEENLMGNETILLVEDDEIVRRVAVDILTRYNYNVIQAPNGADALSLCERMEKPVDLVIADVIMPNMSGPEFIRRLKNIWPEFKNLFISGYSENGLIDMGAIDHYLQKPFRPRALAQKVREVLNSGNTGLAAITPEKKFPETTSIR